MKLLILREKDCDFTEVLESCDVEIDKMSLKEAMSADIAQYDAYCVLLPEAFMDARLRQKMEVENKKGKRVFTEAIGSYLDLYGEAPVNTVRSRLIYLEPENGNGIPGLEFGELLDEQSNFMIPYCFFMPDTEPLLVYQKHIVAHTHTNMSRENILKESKAGMWSCCNNTVLMTSFQLHNFNRARFAPRNAWIRVIEYIAEWLTGNKPSYIPESVVSYGVDEDLSDSNAFEKCRRNAIEKGIRWLEQFLIEDGYGGIREGLHHDIDPDGNQIMASGVRTDCTGESAGAFKMYARVAGIEKYEKIGSRMDDFVYGPMVVKDGMFDGMMRWTEQAWGVCYQDDVARAILPAMYDCIFFENNTHFPTIQRVLDFLIKTTAKDGTRVFRTDNVNLNEKVMAELAEAEIGNHAAHYNAYYSALLLLAYKYSGEKQYLDIGRRGLETLMNLYPETTREQSETQEMCRLVLPLAILYDVSGEEKHREMLYRVVSDLQKVKHPFGGYQEWDTGYKAAYNRNSETECSILTENGDPVADLLYSCNFLPMGFAYAYNATKDEWFYTLWHEIVAFFISTQIKSNNPFNDGSWCRAFDMDLEEAYAAPHDSGWATYSSETGWTCAEILMGMMFLDALDLRKLKQIE